MNILRIKKLIFLHLQHLPMKSRAWRPLVCKWGGVQIISPKRTFIGEGVIFDTNYPQDIFIEEGVRLTSGVKIVTHFMNPNTRKLRQGEGSYLQRRLSRNEYFGGKTCNNWRASYNWSRFCCDQRYTSQ